MLLAVEGVGFFSSSASGYSKGLMLLVLGWSKEERPMRVAPWNQYQLVEQEGDFDHQLATKKSGASCGCASFICVRRAPARVDGPSPPKVGPVNHSETLPASSSPTSDRGKACSTNHAVDESNWKAYVKSSLKKPSTICSTIPVEGDHAHDSTEEAQNSAVSCTERRKVHWTDSCGGELVHIREFEPRYVLVINLNKNAKELTPFPFY